MSVTITPVDVATDTFSTFIAKVNNVIDTLAANVVSTNSSANGAVTTGNAQLTGHLHANVLSTHSLHGGNNQASAVLPITSNVSIGNSTVNVVVTFDTITLGTTVVNSTVLAAGANVYANTTAVQAGNSTVNSVLTGTGLTTGLSVSNQLGHYVGANVALTAALLGIGNSTVNAVMNSSVLVIGRVDAASVNIAGLTQNSTFLGVGANVYMNTSSFFVGNSTVNAVLNSVGLVVGNSIINSTAWALGTIAANTTVIRNGANAVLETARLFLGNSTINAVINSVALVTGVAVVNNSGLAVGSNVVVNATHHFVGNSTVNVVINSSVIAVGSGRAVTSHEDRQLLAGYTSNAANDGVVSSGTYTPVATTSNFRKLVGNGAFTFAVPSTAGDYTLIVQLTNGTGAGTVTFSGSYNIVDGDSLTTTSGHDFFVSIIKCNGFYSATVKALQ